MSSKDAISKTAAAPPNRRNTEPAYDLFDSLRRARSKAKESRQKPQSRIDDQPQDTARRDDE